VVPILEAEVVEETLPDPTAPLAASTPNSVPLLPAEVVEEVEPTESREPASWRTPPPVRNAKASAAARAPAEPLAEVLPVQEAAPAAEADPLAEAPPAWQFPPPVRRATGDELPNTVSPELGSSVQVFESATQAAGGASDPGLVPPPPAARARRTIGLIFAMVVVTAIVISTVAVYSLGVLFDQEGKLYAKARNDYANGQFASAAAKYEELGQRFPSSDHLQTYQFFAELSKIRDQVQVATVEARVRLRRFLDEYKGSEPVTSSKADIHRTLLHLAELLAELAKKDNDSNLLKEAQASLAECREYHDEGSSTSDERAIQNLIAQAEKSIAEHQKYQRVLDYLDQILARAKQITNDIVREAREYVAREGYAGDAEVKRRIALLEEAVRQLVRYVPHQASRHDVGHSFIEPSEIIAPLLAGNPPPVRESRRVILALVRGVLYALDQETGAVQWATRVGIDTTTLPIRLKATPVSPELFLVLSADRNTIMTLVAQDGRLFWQHQLSGPCLGRPVVVGRRAYVPTYDGKVHEVELVEGNVLGHYELGQPLTVGGVWQEGTDLLYFPGDSDNVYVLDMAMNQAPSQKRDKSCVAILRTGHPSGSLRSEPIIVNRLDPFARTEDAQRISPPYLILSQADGLDSMKLRVYDLPITNPDVQPLLQPEPHIHGWSWFQPYHDSEKLAFMTDVGVLGLFGINQVRNEDLPLFPLLPDLPKSGESTPRLGRGQVVHAVEDYFWVLGNGALEMVHFDLFSRKVIRLWGPLPLGSPLHASQLDETGKTLFVVTQDLNRQISLATAVEAETGTVLWQRQLGVECLGDPLVLGKQILLVDRGGGLFRFEPGKHSTLPGREWRISDPVVAPPLPAGASTPYLLPAPDGRSVYELATSERSKKLTIRKYRLAAEGQTEGLEKYPVDLPTPLAGTPAVGPQSLLLPLADGSIQKLTLPLDGSAGVGGPDWRSRRADDDARGHVVMLSADEFLTTDGSRGLTHWVWPPSDQFKSVPPNQVPTVQLPARIVAAPVVLPRANSDSELQVCAADADGNICLLRGPELKLERIWNLRGKITAGPFLRGSRIGCVVDRSRLAWLDPAKPRPLWEHELPGEDIVGEPQLVGDMLVVADVSGHFVGLNPQNGRLLGMGYSLKARAAPVATPVAFGPDEAFVPLTDGTVFSLALKYLRDPLWGLPLGG
jgi:hypothetical protein